MNALNLNGPEFLAWYLQAFTLAILALPLLRWLLRRASKRALQDPLDLYDVAWLRDGARGVVRTALASLHRRELIAINGDAVSARAVEPGGALHTVERAVLRVIGDGSKQPAMIEDGVARACAEIESRLAARRLALSPAGKARARWIPLLGMLFCLSIGIAKVMVGISRGRPVGFLILLLIVSAVLLWLAARARLRRTTAGDYLLQVLAYRHAALRTTLATPAGRGMAPGDIGLAVALWGTAAIGTMEFLPLRDVLEPRKAFARSSGSSSSGCGGGHSCGGGDGGGGGCGGCGGGGGD